MFPIRQIDQLQSEDIEYLGTKRKFWCTIKGQRFLFKAEERGTGEDWAEKVVCELTRRLGLPHVEYELAHEFEGQKPIQPGVICPTFVPRPLALVLGNQLLYRRDPAKERVQTLKEGEQLYLMPDLMNETDFNAVALRTVEGNRFMLGYVPRYLAQDVWKIMQGCHPDFIHIFVHRVNRDAPLQQRLLCRMQACWPDGFKPCSGEEFQPIPAGVSALCTA